MLAVVVVVCWWWWLVVFLLGCGSCFPAGAQQGSDTDMHVAERRVRLLQSCAQAVMPMLLLPACPPVAQILDRKGFVRIAVESGTPIVPVWHFGNSKLFR